MIISAYIFVGGVGFFHVLVSMFSENYITSFCSFMYHQSITNVSKSSTDVLTRRMHSGYVLSIKEEIGMSAFILFLYTSKFFFFLTLPLPFIYLFF